MKNVERINEKIFGVGVKMFDYDKKIDMNRKRNEKYIKEFEEWLNKKGLVNKTIRKHLNNVDLYINDYLNYYEITKMEDGTTMIYSFLNNWFIRKCLYASKTSIKENAASIKKFYQCMSEKKYIDVEKYKILCEIIKDNMDVFLDSLDEYDNMDYEEYF